jgi:hypothetical protein
VLCFFTAGLIIVAGLGAVVSLIAGNTLRLAFQQIGRAREWWSKQVCRDQFPRLCGGPPREPRRKQFWYWLLSTGKLPYWFFWASHWLITSSLVGLMTAILIVVRRETSLPNAASLMEMLTAEGVVGMHSSM